MTTTPKPVVPLILAALVALASCGPTPLSSPEDAIPQDQGLVHIRLPQKENRSLNTDQTQGFTDYYEVIFKEVNTTNYYAGTGRTGDTVTLQVPGNTTYEILILGGYEYQNRHILLGSVFANKLNGEEADYEATAAGIWIDGGTPTELSFTLKPLLLDPVTDYTLEFSGTDSLDTNGTPERINGRLAYIADTEHPLKDQEDDLSITVALKHIPSLVLAEGGTEVHLAKVQGRFDRYDPAVDTFIYYTLMTPTPPPSGFGYPLNGNDEVSLGFTLPVSTIQEVDPADGDWRFDFEATYYGFGTSAFGGTQWTIRNGLGADLDRVGSIGGGLWVHFGNGNGFRDTELSAIEGTLEQSGIAAAGAELQLLNQDGTVYKAGTSGWDGRYSIEDVAPGTYMLEAWLFEAGTGALFFNREAVSLAGNRLTVDLDLEPGYSVNYELNGGGATAPLNLKVRPHTPITLAGLGDISAPAGSGKTFYYWDDGSQTWNAEAAYTVNSNVWFKATWGPFTSVAAVAAYLGTFTGAEGASTAAPIPLCVEVNLGSLKSTLDAAGKYVALILPAVTALGYNDFYGKTWLVSMSLPEATSIGYGAFEACTNLSVVNIPKIGGSISMASFYRCPLTSITIGESWNINTGAYGIRNGFTGYYNTDHGSGAQAAGRYLFDGVSWTGPFPF